MAKDSKSTFQIIDDDGYDVIIILKRDDFIIFFPDARSTTVSSQGFHLTAMHCNRFTKLSASLKAMVSSSNATLSIVWDHASRLSANGEGTQWNHGEENVVQSATRRTKVMKK